MYKISNNKRKYSTTPIVRQDADGNEDIVLVVCNHPKKDGDVFAEEIVEKLNSENVLSEKELSELLQYKIKYEQLKAKYDELIEHINKFLGKTDSIITKIEAEKEKTYILLKSNERIALYEKFLDEFCDENEVINSCNADAVFNWFGWNVWRNENKLTQDEEQELSTGFHKKFEGKDGAMLNCQAGLVYDWFSDELGFYNR
jgi:hypothetical protein